MLSNERNVETGLTLYTNSNIDFTPFTYRSILFEKEDKQVTQLKPDENSSPLRVSREELGDLGGR